MTTKTVMVIEDPNDPEELLLDLGTELCAELGWQVGDIVEWIDQKDGSWLIQKKVSTNISTNLNQV
jgi:DNA-binding Xre family transcriptional regulator